MRDDVDAELRAFDLVHGERGAVDGDRALGRNETGDRGRDADTEALRVSLRDNRDDLAYIVDFKDFDAYNKVYREFFPKDPPARATVAVNALNQGGRVELQMIAVRAK